MWETRRTAVFYTRRVMGIGDLGRKGITALRRERGVEEQDLKRSSVRRVLDTFQRLGKKNTTTETRKTKTGSPGIRVQAKDQIT